MSKTTETEQTLDTKITLKNVRLSYPNLFTPKKAKGSDKEKYSAAFLLDKADPAHDIQIKAIQALIAAILKEKNKGKALAADKIALKDGDTDKPDTDGYENHKFISSTSDRAPQVIDRVKGSDGKFVPIKSNDSRVFGGIYVNAVVRLWFQDNEFGKRINASLEAVQYVRTGEAFGAGAVDVEDAFGGIENPEEESGLDDL